MDPSSDIAPSDDVSVEIIEYDNQFSPFKSNIEREFFEEDVLMNKQKNKQMKRSKALKAWKWDEIVDLLEDVQLEVPEYAKVDHKLAEDLKVDEKIAADGIVLEQKGEENAYDSYGNSVDFLWDYSEGYESDDELSDTAASSPPKKMHRITITSRNRVFRLRDESDEDSI